MSTYALDKCLVGSALFAVGLFEIGLGGVGLDLEEIVIFAERGPRRSVRCKKGFRGSTHVSLTMVWTEEGRGDDGDVVSGSGGYG